VAKKIAAKKVKVTSQGVGNYIAAAPPFARPILRQLRKAFLTAHPEITEAIKWGVPHFEYKGILGGMAAFKQYVSFGFWKSELMDDPEKLFHRGPKSSMCVSRFAKVEDLPSLKVLTEYVLRAVALNERGAKLPSRNKPPKPAPRTPSYFRAALAKNRRAKATFDKLSASHRREYIEWFEEAKQAATRERRLAQALEWLAEGKSRNWKYERKMAT
jgi:uncharacterized protein YdeI (YjbR/CyaY-like superfamily)